VMRLHLTHCPFPTVTATNVNQQFPNIFCLASPPNWLLLAIVGTSSHTTLAKWGKDRE